MEEKVYEVLLHTLLPDTGTMKYPKLLILDVDFEQRKLLNYSPLTMDNATSQGYIVCVVLWMLTFIYVFWNWRPLN